MKKTLVALFISLLFLSFPLTIFAHGGVEKRADDVLVTLFQTPLSPLVGENVSFAFVTTDVSKNTRLVNKAARLVVTQTTTGDASKDKIIFTKNVVSDSNGIINFSYTFPKTNYYDIDLEFGKPNDETHTTGFLVQPRTNLKLQEQIFLALLSISLTINIVIFFYWIIGKKMKRIHA